MAPTVPAWLEEICDRLRRNDQELKTIDLTHPHIDDVSAKIFANAMNENTVVETLILSCYAIVDDGAFAVGSIIRDCRTIRKLQLKDIRHGRELTTFFQLLCSNVGLVELSLRHCTICSGGATAIATFFRSHSGLQEFRVTDSQFTGNALAILCQDGLKQSSPSLERVFFVNDELEGEQSAKLIVDTLSQSSIRELVLSENELGDAGTAVLVEGILHHNTSVRLLDLRSNNITETGAFALQGLIVARSDLRVLNLSHNALGNIGVGALARGLQSSSSRLQKLTLCSTNVQSPGASVVATMLRANKCLEELDLSFNDIGPEGAADIAKALQRNSKLRHLNLRRNNIGNTGAQKFAQKLPSMHGLKELIFSKNKIGVDGAAALLDGLRSNVQLEYLNVEEKLSTSVSKEIVHYIRLNKAGRRIFRSANTVPEALWPQLYGRISGDMDTLFHFLAEKPDAIPLPDIG